LIAGLLLLKMRCAGTNPSGLGSCSSRSSSSSACFPLTVQRVPGVVKSAQRSSVRPVICAAQRHTSIHKLVEENGVLLIPGNCLGAAGWKRCFGSGRAVAPLRDADCAPVTLPLFSLLFCSLKMLTRRPLCLL